MISAPTSKGSTNPESSQAAQSAEGFILSHISGHELPNAAQLSIFSDITEIHMPSDEQHGGGKRKKIFTLSSNSRNRFLKDIAKARNIQGGAAVTLTYPAEFPTDPKIYKEHLHRLLKRFQRWEPSARGWWRLEFQQRGAPHYHLLIFGARRNVRQLRRWFKVAWYEVVGSGNLYHLQAGTQVDLIKNRKHAIFYAAKYASKGSQAQPNPSNVPGDRHTGRQWGRFGEIDRRPALVVSLLAYQVIEIKRQLVRFLHSKRSNFERRLARSTSSKGFSVFGAGDQSQESWQSLYNSTIYGMVEPFLTG